MSIRACQRNRTNRVYVYYEQLAHAIVKAEKSHDLPSASWGPRKVSSVIELKGLGTRVADDVKSQFGGRRG